jgi:hypothetical protein
MKINNHKNSIISSFVRKNFLLIKHERKIDKNELFLK